MDDGGVWADQSINDQRSEQFPKLTDVPGGMGEEAVVVGEVPVADRIAGNDQIRDITMSNRQDPTSHEQSKGVEARLSENR